MSDPINDGGQAFAGGAYGCTGMTLRDYFATQALTPMILMEGRDYYSSHAFSYAKAAYHLADAMLAAREIKEGSK